MLEKFKKHNHITLTVSLIMITTVATPALAQTKRLQQQSTVTQPSHKHTQQTALPHIDLLQSPLFSVGTYGDSMLGVIAEVKLASYLSHSQRDALALELNAGPNVFRANTTYGLGITDKQRIKVTYDYLRQQLDFDFASGTTSQWVDQSAIGMDYAYLLDNRFFESIEWGGYFSHSSSKTLSDAPVDTSLSKYTQRRIAGANAGNIHADLALHLWPHSRLTGGIDYDIVHFDTQYKTSAMSTYQTTGGINDSAVFRTKKDEDIQGLGGHVQLEQRLLPQLKATLRAGLRQTEYQYTVGIGWLLPSPSGTQFELNTMTNYVDSHATGHRFFTNGARLNMAFSPSTGIYNESTNQSHRSILDWTRKPAVRMTTVLAIADSTAYIRPLTIAELQNALGPSQTLPASGTVLSAGGGWITDITSDQGTVVGTVTSFSKATFSPQCVNITNCSAVQTFYISDQVNDNHAWLVRNDVSGTIGNNWTLNNNTGSWECTAGPTQCLLKPKT